MNKKNEWQSDFNEFMSFDDTKVPAALSEKVLVKMDSLLNPKATTVFAKVLGIHLIVSSLSLSICHQFGLNPFNTEHSLDNWFMHMAGHHVCMALCGVVFIAVGILSAGLILNIEEMASLKKNGVLQVASLSLFSLAFLFLIGAEFAIGIGLLWLLGALAGGLIATETIWRFRHSGLSGV